MECFKNKHVFETDHTNTPTDAVFAHSGVSMQNPFNLSVYAYIEIYFKKKLQKKQYPEGKIRLF
jgi:hypothetical protein